LPSPCWLRTRRDGAAVFALAWLVLTLVPSLAIVWKSRTHRSPSAISTCPR
jgi:hypothetical protein